METGYVEFTEKDHVSLKSEDLNTEDLAPWEVIVRNEATLISAGTELARLHDVGGVGSFPSRPGYAAIGRIAEKGAAVTDFAVGDRIFYAGKHASVQRFLHGQDHQWGRLYPVPAGIEPQDAVFACLAEIAMAAPNVTQLDLGDTVAVFGLGLVGNLAAQEYKLMGARVIALDPVAERCALAESVGLDTVLSVPAEEQVEAIMDLTDGRGADVTVDAVGHSAVIANCVQATALFGQTVLVGTPRAAHECNATTMLNRIHERGLAVRGAH